MASEGCYNIADAGIPAIVPFASSTQCLSFCYVRQLANPQIVGFALQAQRGSTICGCVTAANLGSAADNGCGACPGINGGGNLCGESGGNRETVFFTPIGSGGGGPGPEEPSSTIDITRTVVGPTPTVPVDSSTVELSTIEISTASLLPTETPLSLGTLPSTGTFGARIPSTPNTNTRPTITPSTSDNSTSNVQGGASPALIGGLAGVGAAVLVGIVCVWIFVIAPRRRREKERADELNLDFPSTSTPAVLRKDTVNSNNNVSPSTVSRPMPVEPIQQQQGQYGYYDQNAYNNMGYDQQQQQYTPYDHTQQNQAYYANMYASHPQDVPQGEGLQRQYTQHGYVQPPEAFTAQDQTVEAHQVEPVGGDGSA
ncbi:hypothetical protein HDV05_001037, partial [Chytridiales sp. JEL 0842]